MKLYKYKNQLLIIMLAVGFFVGILYENIVSKSFGVSLHIFRDYFLSQYKETEIIVEEYFWYVVKARILPIFVIVVLGCMKWKRILSCVAAIWTGFMFGILMVAALIQLGMKGLLFCVIGMMPHMICYIMAYCVLLIYYYHYPRSIWNFMKTCFVTVCMFLGIIAEVYLNPLLIKLVVKIM